jgi:CheY-like chemotaxis protein
MARIMLVDDEKDIVELLSFLLQKEGFEVVSATNGREALEKVGLMPSEQPAIKPDLMVLDIMMPEIDGYTVATRMLENESTKSIPIVILTAKGQMKELFGMATNVVAYIEKPFDPQLLISKLSALVKK